MNATPPQIVDALRAADIELDTLATQFAWFKGQRDYWKSVYDYQFARAKIIDDGPVGKSKEAAEVAVNELLYEIPWLPGNKLSLAEMLRVVEASFDLMSKRYDRMEKHISILQSVNKNIMMDYQRAGNYD